MPNPPRLAIRPGRVTSVGPDIANFVVNGNKTVAGDCHADITDYTYDDTSDDPAGIVAWEVQVRNESGADKRVWLGGRLSDATGDGEFDVWSAGQFVAASTTYSDDTDDAKDAGANDFAMGTTTNNDGFLVGADRKWNCLVVDVGTAYNNGGTALGTASSKHFYQYWNGSGWTNVTLLSPAVDLGLAAQEYAIVFAIPDDWTAYEDGDVNGVDTRLIGQYVLRYINGDAPSASAALATRLYVGTARKSMLLVPDGGTDVSDNAPIPLCGRDERVWMVTDGAAADVECFLTGEKSAEVQNIGV